MSVSSDANGKTICQLRFPRIIIEYCTQCRWMLRAAYFGQELLSTFGTDIGEVALQPSTGGIFKVYVLLRDPTTAVESQHDSLVALWDRQRDGGFPDSKELKRRLRDVIDPGRNLGHVDKSSSSPTSLQDAVGASVASPVMPDEQKKAACEDCR